jgi:ribosomal protein L34
MTVAWPGISVSICGPRDAETTTLSETPGGGVGVGLGVGLVGGLACARREAAPRQRARPRDAGFVKRMTTSFARMVLLLAVGNRPRNRIAEEI